MARWVRIPVIAIVGYANLDLLVAVPSLPAPGDRIHASAMERRVGGMAANAAVAAARFGSSVIFVGAVGPDHDGACLLDDLVAHGVDVSDTTTTQYTSTAVVLVAPDGQRAIISQDDAVGPTEVKRAISRLESSGGGFLYLDGYRWPWAAGLLDNLRPSVHVVVDVDGLADPEALVTIAETAAYVFASRSHLAALLAAGTDIDGVVRRLASEHQATVVVTDGARGWLLTDGSETCSGPALPATTVDSTGAGDAFCGAFVASLDSGEDLPAAARLAAAAAAISTTGRGAHAVVASRQQAEALLARSASTSET